MGLRELGLGEMGQNPGTSMPGSPLLWCIVVRYSSSSNAPVDSLMPLLLLFIVDICSAASVYLQQK